MISDSELRNTAVDHLWMPFSNLSDAQQSGGPRVIVRAEGVRLWDSEGNEYLDGVAAFECSQIGHGRERVARAVYEQLLAVDMVESFRYTTRPAVELARKLAELAPGDLNRVFLSNGGAEAVEAALKIARHSHINRGSQYKTKVITRAGSFHGTSFGAMVVDGGYKSTRPYLYEPLSPTRVIALSTYRRNCHFCSEAPACTLQCADDIARTIERERPETVSAVVLDPCSTAAGVSIPPPGYLRQVREICDTYDVVLIVDEIVTGFGRTGHMFACDLFDVVPDIMTVSKGLSSGYAPIAATLVSERLAQTFFDQLPLSHGQTFAGHPSSCAAALENIAIIEEEGLVERARTMAPYFAAALHNGLSACPGYLETRAVGLIAGIEFDLSQDTCTAIRSQCRDLGLIILTLHPGNVFFLCPPLVVTESEIDEMVAILRTAITSTTSK